MGLREPRWLWPLLAATLALGLALRLWHHYRWALWGSDTGEYLVLTQRLVADGALLEKGYLGWGRAYPYFQGMELLAGGAALTTGLAPATTLLWLVPAAGALALPALFLLARHLTDGRVALFATAAYASSFAVVFANSHPMPGGLADPLGLLLLLAWVRWLATPARWWLPLILLLTGLLPTHHFTLLLVAAGATGMLLVELAAGNREVAGNHNVARRGIAALGVAAVAIALYWVGYATPFRELVLGSARLPLGALLALPPLALGGLWLVSSRLRLPTVIAPEPRALQRRLALAAGGAAALLVLVLWRGVPGTAIPVDLAALPYLLPPLAWLAFAAAPSLVATARRGWLLWGWLLPMAALAAIGGATGSHLLIAYRHAPYLLAPLAIMAGIGVAHVTRLLPVVRRPLLAAGLTVVIVAAGLGAYPPPVVMGGFQEGTSAAEFDAVLWCRQTEPAALVVSDHRLSSLVFGLAQRNASWENGAAVITGNASEALAAGALLQTPRAGKHPVAYVLLSREMERGVALEQWDPAEPLTGAAAAKFGGPHFPVWFDNGEARVTRFAP